MFLQDLKLGQKATISLINQEDYKNKLLALGISEGSEIFLVRYSPLKDLILLKIHGHLVALNNNEAKSITIEQA